MKRKKLIITIAVIAVMAMFVRPYAYEGLWFSRGVGMRVGNCGIVCEWSSFAGNRMWAFGVYGPNWTQPAAIVFDHNDMGWRTRTQKGG